MLSPTQKQMLNENGITDSKPSIPKLIPNLSDKSKYILHISNLQLYCALGLKIKKVHRILTFKQRPWLKEYIDFNTEQRKNARNEFEKDFFKLLNNSVFGKTMENLRNRRNFDLVNNITSLKKFVAQPTFKGFTIFHEDLVAIERKIASLTLNRPIYTGLCILDLSKTLMYNWHYKYVKQQYPDNKSKLLFTDTDSLVYLIQTEDLYDDMYHSSNLFDFSGYDKSHKCYDSKNKKIMGKMKDELNGKVMIEFVGLRSKMYSLKCKDDDLSMKKAKGVRKNVVHNQLTHEHYIKALFDNIKFFNINKGIRSYKHKLYSIKQNKVSLCGYDDKRYILNDGISTLAYGHYQIVNQ